MKWIGLLVTLFISIPGLARIVQDAGPSFSYQTYEGKTFSALGPNCFATAMKVAGLTESFRGMDEKEFRVIRESFCQPIAQPRPGDIGVFERPGFAFVHAYIYVSAEWGLQKPGVDYNGKTPIALQALDSINYVFLASPECRRFSRDISECANAHYYLRCTPFQESLRADLPELETRIRALEQRIDHLLEVPEWTSREKNEVLDLQIVVRDLRQDISTMALPLRWRAYIEARQISLEKQMEFFALKTR